MKAVPRTAAPAKGGRKDAQRLDEIDRRILRALQQDARLTTAQLADKIGLSTTPCWNRLKRLETQGYIDGYIALLNQEKLGLPETVIIEITLDRHDDEILERFGQLLSELPEVIEAYLTTGGYDYLVKVARKEGPPPKGRGSFRKEGGLIKNRTTPVYAEARQYAQVSSQINSEYAL